MVEYDFSGWATKANVLCSDGRTIMPGAFKDNDGKTVPLVWNHKHDSPDHVLGHALLENRDEGVYAYCKFNDSESARTAKLLVEHGDIEALSIYANQLKEKMSHVMHGNIREVSLVLAGANVGASIQSVIKHGEESDEEAVIYTGEEISLYHAEEENPEDDPNPEGENDELVHSDDKKEDPEKKDTPDKKDEKDDSKDDKSSENETIEDVFKTLNEKQKKAVYAVVGQAIDDTKAEYEKEDSKGGDKDMKHNVFDKEDKNTGGVLCHADQEAIIKLAKSSQVGSFQTALQIYAEQNELQHADTVTAGGFVETGDGNIYNLFPEYKDVRPGAPELITSDQGWIGVVMSKVHKSPISRIRTSQVDIRKIDTLRAKGYKKGTRKTPVGNFKLIRRTTDPQTVYVKNALHRDDIIDITTFDYVQYLYNIDRTNLNEELATAIMLGDGRDDGDEGKISPDHIRPIWTDDDLYTIHVDLDMAAAKAELQGTNTGANFGENYITAEAMINTLLYAREDFKGTGTPDLFITPHMLNVMLLARDLNGRRIYSSKAELASSLNVGNIVTAEQFEGKVRTTTDNKKKKLLAIVTNLADYSLGATKGGEVTHFTQFDIDFNQEKSLLETRCSGSLTRVYSAIAIEEPVADSNPVG